LAKAFVERIFEADKRLLGQSCLRKEDERC
jgi:hypothetical protein